SGAFHRRWRGCRRSRAVHGARFCARGCWSGFIEHMVKKQQLDPLLKLALDIGPLVLFFAANSKFGIFIATAVFMAAVLIALAVSYAMTRHLAVMPLVTAGIVLLFGGLTPVPKTGLLIKLKPTIFFFLLGPTLMIGLAFGKPLLGAVFDSVYHL